MVKDFLGGIDIGGTKIAVAIASTDGQVVGRRSFPTDHDRSPYDSMNHSLESLVNLAKAHHGQLASIGIGCVGPLDFALGHVLTPPNMPGSWWQFPLRPFVEDKLRLPVALENDANAAALGEHLYGAGRGYSDLVYFTISTGIGVGIIAGDKLVHRLGEGGHVTVQPGGARCACGARGCMETLCSGTGIARRAREQLQSGGISKMLDMAGDIKELTAKTVEDAAREGDAVATEVWRETIDLLAIGIGSIITLLSPQAVILGGGVGAGAGEFLLQPLRDAIKERVHIISMQEVSVLQAGLGNDSVIYGALALAVQVFQPIRTSI